MRSQAKPCTCTVVFMPGATTSTACGEKGKSFRNAVVVSPFANFSDTAMAAHSSKFVGMPFSCAQTEYATRATTHQTHSTGPEQLAGLHAVRHGKS